MYKLNAYMEWLRSCVLIAVRMSVTTSGCNNPSKFVTLLHQIINKHSLHLSPNKTAALSMLPLILDGLQLDLCQDQTKTNNTAQSQRHKCP